MANQMLYATLQLELREARAELATARAEAAALRAALQSLVDGKSEFDIEYDTGMPADEARKIMDLAYNRQ